MAWNAKNSAVYHNNLSCSAGNSIETDNRKQGKDDKRLCKECKHLNSAKKGNLPIIAN